MLRPFTNEDLGPVLDIWLSASVAAHDFIDAEFWRSKLGQMRDVYLPSSECFVYERSGAVLGFSALVGDTLAALFVGPVWQGKGIGSELIRHAKTQRNMLDLTVYKSNFNSVEFYKKHEFSIIKEQVDEHTGHPELLMVWNA